MIYVVADMVQTRADPESGQGSPPPCLAATVCEKCLRLIFSVQHTHQTVGIGCRQTGNKNNNNNL